MKGPSGRQGQPEGTRRGTAMPMVLVALVALLAVSALSIDAGLLWTSRTQLQGVVDASVLAATANLIDVTVPAVTETAAQDAADEVAALNAAAPVTSVALTSVTLGRWDTDSETFDNTVDTADPDLVNAVKVVADLDGAQNSAVPAFMSRVLGRDSFDVSALATAFLGFAGSAAEGELDLPIAIDCCALQGAACAIDYCDNIESNPPNPCPLEDTLIQGAGLPQDTDDPANPVSCLDLEGTTVQNACWTNFEPPDGSRINTHDLRDLIDAGNPADISIGFDLQLSNGDMTDAFRNLSRRFELEGKNRYPPSGDKDSWVVRLPVVDCQQNTQPCKDGEITGFVCFEIRQIEVVPGKMVRGRFLCRERDAELFEDCKIDGSTSGGEDFSIMAEIPVLVQ